MLTVKPKLLYRSELPTHKNELFHRLTNHRLGIFLSDSSRAHRDKFWFRLDAFSIQSLSHQTQSHLDSSTPRVYRLAKKSKGGRLFLKETASRCCRAANPWLT
ncbi:hypothetical protein NPIL_691521 [Nephila pilipes]|uniref:Uncharacterized protein n=1 Tax=Nephila pilipes TaxID=299642 RepID=A0A8X6QT96_NEPPI|nr:hypothetical protein NPIL_691521 [Nephila pilipes]